MFSPTIMEGLNPAVLQSYVNAIQSPLTYDSYFPRRKNVTFSWKTVENVLQQPNVAAEIMAQNATVARKKRPIFQSATGDLPLISISREMKRSEMKDYQIARAVSSGDTASLARYWADDVSFCYNGVHAEYEYIGWALMSKAGTLDFTTANNVAFANEFALDYQVEDDNKIKNTVPWATSATATPIKDIQAAVKQAKELNLNVKHMWINLDNWYLLQSTKQMIDLTKVYVNGSTVVEVVPSLEDVNSAIKKMAYLQGLTIHVIDQTITRESAEGIRTSGNPFDDHVAVFTESTVMGSSQYATLEQDTKNVMYAQRENVLIKKYGTPEPLTEITIGESDGIVVLDSAYRNIYMKTNNTTW